MKKRFLAFVALGWMVTSGVTAQELEPSIEGVRIYGGDVGLTWGPWKLVAGGGWEELDLGRDSETGLVLEPTTTRADPVVALPFPNAAATFGFTQKDTSVQPWVLVGVWGHGNLGAEPSSGAFPDLDGNAFGFLRSGVTYDGRTEAMRGVSQGVAVEAYAEWGPRWAAVRPTDYVKVNVSTSWRIPLWILPAPEPLFAGTLALRANAGWIDGDQVPVPLLEGTEVRGYHQLFDTQFRSVVSSELRVSLPSLWGDHDLVPVVLAFTEGGWYRGYTDTPSGADASGWLASVGAGAGLAIFGAVTPTVQLVMPLIREHDLKLKFSFTHRF